MNLIPKIKEPIRKFRVFVETAEHLSKLQSIVKLTSHFLNTALIDDSEDTLRKIQDIDYIFNIEEEYIQE